MHMQAIYRAVASAIVFSLGVPAGVRAGDAPPVAVKGYDVVAYFTQGAAVKGSADFRSEFDGAQYQFANASHRQAFAAAPDRYTPQFSSLCAAAMSNGRHAEADPTMWKIIDGKLYMFGTAVGLGKANEDPQLVVRAQKTWAAQR